MTGLYGIVSREPCSETLYFGTDYHSHMGTERGGMATIDESGSFDHDIHDIRKEQFKAKFSNAYREMIGNKGIGVISDKDDQPLIMPGKFTNDIDRFAIVTSGRITNLDDLFHDLCTKGDSFSQYRKDNPINTTEVIGTLINKKDSIADGISFMQQKIEGSCSVLLLKKEGIYAARDAFGKTPLIVGKNSKEEWAVCSETNSFPNHGFKIQKELLPGEIVLVNEYGPRTLKEGNRDNLNICAFLYIYTGFPASQYEGISVEAVRNRCGIKIASHDADLKVDIVNGIPDSGTGHGLGYAMGRMQMAWQWIEENIEMIAKLSAQERAEIFAEHIPPPYARPIVKYTPTYPRSFTPPSQDIRDAIAYNKLIPLEQILRDVSKDPSIVQGKRVVEVEDSIVRNTQLRNTIDKIWEYGASEIHVRPACPPLMFPCKYLNSTNHTLELVARRAINYLEGKEVPDNELAAYLDHTSKDFAAMVDWIRKDLKVTSTEYPTMDETVESIGLKKGELCRYCWRGNYD